MGPSVEDHSSVLEQFRPSDEKSSDENADVVMNLMMAGLVAAAVVPPVINWPILAGAMGSGVVAIGRCYGVELSRVEAWKLIRQFILAAGFTFIGLQVGVQIVNLVLASTGVGYVGAAALQAAVAAPLAYAVGASAKAYFQGELHKKQTAATSAEIGEILRQKFHEAKRARGAGRV